MKKNGNLIGVALASLISINGSPATAADQLPAGDNPQAQSSDKPGGVEASVAAKQQLIDALKSMKNNPESIDFNSAMCYKMSLPPAVFEHSCPGCGHVTAHQYNGFAGRTAREMSSIRRSLPNLPVKITVDESSLCEKCSKSPQPELVFTTQCGNCPTSFTWKITSGEELEKLDFLFLNYPTNEINLGAGKFQLKDAAKVREIVEFVSGCMFCPACLEKMQLKY